MEKRVILKSILTGNLSAKEAQQWLAGDNRDLTLLTPNERQMYFDISHKIGAVDYEGLTDHELILCILLCYKATTDTPNRNMLDACDLTHLNPQEADRLQELIR
jgi:hypothetical protein